MTTTAADVLTCGCPASYIEDEGEHQPGCAIVACPDCCPHDEADCFCDTCHRTGWAVSSSTGATNMVAAGDYVVEMAAEITAAQLDRALALVLEAQRTLDGLSPDTVDIVADLETASSALLDLVGP